MHIALADAKSENITVLVMDSAARFAIPKSRHIHVFSKIEDKRLEYAHDIFVVTTGLELSHVAEFIRSAHKRKRVRGLLIRQETGQNWIPLLLERAGLRSIKGLLVYSNNDVLKRVLAAWGKYHAQDNLIADAAVVGELLFVRDCAFNHYEVGFKQIKAFSKVPAKDRGNFVISEEGGRISWPAYDIDLGLDSIKYILHPEPFKEIASKHNITYGLAIRKFRKLKKIRQYQIPGVSERHLRRIENGQMAANYKCLQALAKAHKMTMNDYLNQLAIHATKI